MKIGNLELPWLEDHFGTVLPMEYSYHIRKVVEDTLCTKVLNFIRRSNRLADFLLGDQGPPGAFLEDPVNLPSTPLMRVVEKGYQCVSNNTPDAGCEVFRLSGEGSVLYINALFPLTTSLNVPKGVVFKYQIGAGLPSQAPQDWSVTFYDQEDLEIGADV
jgi:hypothetical protein